VSSVWLPGTKKPATLLGVTGWGSLFSLFNVCIYLACYPRHLNRDRRNRERLTLERSKALVVIALAQQLLT